MHTCTPNACAHAHTLTPHPIPRLVTSSCKMHDCDRVAPTVHSNIIDNQYYTVLVCVSVSVYVLYKCMSMYTGEERKDSYDTHRSWDGDGESGRWGDEGWVHGELAKKTLISHHCMLNTINASNWMFNQWLYNRIYVSMCCDTIRCAAAMGLSACGNVTVYSLACYTVA